MADSDALYGFRRVDCDKIIRQLLEAVPELRDAYEQEAHNWRDEGLSPFLTFDLVVTPWLDANLTASSDLDAVRRLFAVFESSVRSPSADVREMVETSTLEYIALTPWVLEATLPLMGPATRDVVIAMRDWRPEPMAVERRWWQIWKRA